MDNSGLGLEKYLEKNTGRNYCKASKLSKTTVVVSKYHKSPFQEALTDQGSNFNGQKHIRCD